MAHPTVMALSLDGDMATLPQYQMADKDLGLLQTGWSKLLNPIISRLQNKSNILQSVSLITGDNIINHGLGYVLTGWRLVRVRAGATIYDKQDTNTTPAVTLVLNASSAVTVDIEVF